MLQYQNCAPSAETLSQVDGASLVDGIDSINVGGISFPQEKVSAYPNERVSVIGVCEQSGSLISWKLNSLDETLIERGLSECDLGSFEVELSDDWQPYCGQQLKLTAQLGAKAVSEINVEVICD